MVFFYGHNWCLVVAWFSVLCLTKNDSGSLKIIGQSFFCKFIFNHSKGSIQIKIMSQKVEKVKRGGEGSAQEFKKSTIQNVDF